MAGISLLTLLTAYAGAAVVFFALDFLWLTVSFPPELARYLVLKGSVAVDGISLTVAGLSGDRFDVQLVPFTVEHTNLKTARIGDSVNLECDMIGKYVVRAMDLRKQ